MSHELLLTCGAPTTASRHVRRARLEEAAGLVPGATRWRVVETDTAATALVETEPAGGSFAEVDTSPARARITVATTRAGLDGPGARSGSEAGHLTVELRGDGSVSLQVDGLATVPVFWGRAGTDMVASTHLASLVSLGLSPEVDTQAAVEYLVLLHPLEDRTLLHDARLLPAGARLERTPAGEIAVDVRPLFLPRADVLSDTEALAEFRAVWATVIGDLLDRTADERALLALSGGLDSRIIAEATVLAGSSTPTYTYGTSRNREAVVAARVAEALDLPHVAVPVAANRRLAHADSIIERLDGAHGPAEMYELWFGDVLRGMGDAVINGLGGGTLWGDDKSVGITSSTDFLARQTGRYGSELRHIAPFLMPHVREAASDLLRDGLVSSTADWDFNARPDTVIFWRMANRQIRWGGMLTTALRRAGLRTETPFLDSRFLGFAARLTADQRRNGHLYLRAHRELFPRTATIARSDDGNAPASLNHVYWSATPSMQRQLLSLARRHPVSAGRRVLHTVGRLTATAVAEHLGDSGLLARAQQSASVFPADLWVRTSPSYRHRLADLLVAEPAGDILDADAVRAASEAVRNGRTGTPALTLGKIATLQRWCSDYQDRAHRVR